MQRFPTCHTLLCSNLFIVKKTIVAHGVKADRLSSVRWKDIIHVHFTDPVILAA